MCALLKDKKQLGEIMASVQKVIGLVTELHNTLKNDTTFAKKFNLPALMDEGKI